MSEITVTAIPAFADNYIWLVCGGERRCAVVDPGDAAPVLDKEFYENIDKYIDQKLSEKDSQNDLVKEIEADKDSGKLIDVWRMKLRRATATKVAIAEIVGTDQNNVGRLPRGEDCGSPQQKAAQNLSA